MMVFALGFLIIIVIGLLLPNNNPNRSIDYSIKKKHMLLDSIKSSKIILSGGSNVLFGYDSKLIADSLKTPTVNHAIHAGYGLKYILDDLEPFINKGDIIILSPEYSHYLDNNYLGSEPLLFSLTAEPKNIRLLSIRQTLHVMPFVTKFSYDRMKSFIYNLTNKPDLNSNNIDIYGEFAINKNGDNNQHWALNKMPFEVYEFNGDFNDIIIPFLENFKKNIENKGTTLYVAYPSLCQSSYQLNKSIIELIDNKLKKSELNVLGKPDDFVQNDSLFFDTPYHLNGVGVKKRSSQLITFLKEFNDLK